MIWHTQKYWLLKIIVVAVTLQKRKDWLQWRQRWYYNSLCAMSSDYKFLAFCCFPTGPMCTGTHIWTFCICKPLHVYSINGPYERPLQGLKCKQTVCSQPCRSNDLNTEVILHIYHHSWLQTIRLHLDPAPFPYTAIVSRRVFTCCSCDALRPQQSLAHM